MKYEILYTKDEISKYLKTCSEYVYFDTETTGLRIHDLLLCITIYDGVKDPICIPTNYYFKDGLKIEDIREVFSMYWKDKKGIAHNAKFDLGVFENSKIVNCNVVADTQLMCHIYNPEQLKNLELRVKEDLHVNKKKFEEIIGKKWDKIDWNKEGDTLIKSLAKYACEDVYYGFQLWKLYSKRLEEDNLMKIHDKIEVPLMYVVKDMHQRGITCDVNILTPMGEQLDLALKNLEKDIHEKAGSVFNLNSPKQVGTILFDKLGLPSIKATKTGNRSTDSATLKELADMGYDICKSMVEYSVLDTLNSNFVKSIPKLMDADGRLRCNFKADGTKTGRFSCTEPNLQNQPNNTDFPIRSSYVATEGYDLLVTDFSQIEPRVMTHLSKDPKLIKIYKDRGDIYIGIAEMLGITRSHAKVVQLAISYGLGPDKLANSLGINKREAEGIIDYYYKTYSVLATYKKSIEQDAEKNKCVRTMYGRVRRLPQIQSTDKRLHFGSLRQAFNTHIQGSAADVIKLVMINLHKKWQHKDAHILLQVHDELVNEARSEISEECFQELTYTMENTVKFDIPIIAEGKICKNWAQMKQKDYIHTQTTLNTIIPLWQIQMM